MTRKQYLAALRELGFGPASKRTAEAFGLSVRQCQNIAAGKTPVSQLLAWRIAELLMRQTANKSD